MKKFYLGIFAFCGVLLSVLALGLIIPRFTPHQNLHFALIDKHNLLLRTPAPRIVLVGGSNLAFGMDSGMLSDSMKMPVVNTSIHAGMGVKYILEDIEPYIKSGDLVILSLEYDLFYGAAAWGYEPMISSVMAIPSNVRLVNMHNAGDLISGVSKEALRNLAKFGVNTFNAVRGKPSPGVYDRDSYNAFGDVIKHFDKPPVEFSVVDIDTEFNPEAIAMIEQFRSKVEGKGAVLFVTYPALNESSFRVYPSKIERIRSEFEARGFISLGTPEEYAFNDSLYYNSKYHLDKHGIKLRTKLLIGDLTKALEEKR
jgi:hypothetical protein